MLKHTLEKFYFDIEFDYSVLDTIKPYKEEVCDYLKHLYNNQKEITLLFSGGMDSRFLARCMIDLKIPFTAYTYVFSENNTDYDSLVSTEFCKQYNIQQEKLYIDANKLFNYMFFLKEKSIVIQSLNPYYSLYAMQEKINTGYEGCFLTGGCSEVRNEEGAIFLPHGFYTLLRMYPNKIFNFTTDRIFFSYMLTDIFKNNYKDRSIDWTSIRDQIYINCYSDLKRIEKQRPDDEYISNPFDETILPQLRSNCNDVIEAEPYFFDAHYFLTRGCKYEDD